MRSLFAGLLLVSLGAASVALAVPTASTVQTGHAPPIHHHRKHHRPIVHHRVVPHHPVRHPPTHHHLPLHHPLHHHVTHHRHPVIAHGAPTSHHRTVHHVAAARRHTELCQQVMVHQHWVQHCR